MKDGTGPGRGAGVGLDSRPPGFIEHPDEMVYVVRDDRGEIMDAGIEEFVDLERMTARYLKLTLTGKDPAKRLVLLIKADCKITVHQLGTRTVGDL